MRRRCLPLHSTPFSFYYLYAQTQDSITLRVDRTAFLPIITEGGENSAHYKQLFIVLGYKTNDPDLIGSWINAVGTFFDSNGNEIAEMSYPNGFTIQDESFIMIS